MAYLKLELSLANDAVAIILDSINYYTLCSSIAML